MQEDQATITSEAALIMEKMVGLSPEEPRYRVLKAAVDYKASWLELAERLNMVAENKEYKEWGYKTFKAYCQEELQLAPVVVSKLVRGFQWVDREAPQLLPRHIEEGDAPALAAREGRAVPDMDVVGVLMKAEREVERDRLSRDTYDEIKGRALRGEQPIKELKKELKDAVTEPASSGDEERLKMLRRTLSAAEKIVTQLEEVIADDAELRALAEQLRERLFERVAAMLDAQAYGEGGSADEEGVDDAPASLPGSRMERVTVIVGAKEDFLSRATGVTRES